MFDLVTGATTQFVTARYARNGAAPLSYRDEGDRTMLQTGDLKRKRESRKQQPGHDAVRASQVVATIEERRRLRDVQNRRRKPRRINCNNAALEQRLLDSGVLRPRRLEEVARPGMWSGHRAFIIGGGPSLRGFNWEQLSGELIVGCNRAFERVTGAFNVSMDLSLFGKLESGAFGPESLEAWTNYAGTRVWLLTNEHKFPTPDPDHPYNIYTVESAGVTAFPRDSLRQLGPGRNSGYMAINLAAVLGADPIYLLGFDMRGDGSGHQAWWHSGYGPKDQGDAAYKNMLECMESLAARLSTRGPRVVNLTPGSAMTCWETGYFEQVINNKPTRPAVATSYGPGGRDRALELRRTAAMFGLKTILVEDPDAATVKPGPRRKAQLIRNALDRVPGPVVWIDSDRTFAAYPELLDNCAFDFLHSEEAPDDGVIYVANSPEVRQALDSWMLSARENATGRDLVSALHGLETTGTLAGGSIPFSGVVAPRPVKGGTVTAITPTGDRPLAFALLRHWLETQTRRPDQWVIVDDGHTPMAPADIPPWATYVRREPGPDDPKHTLDLNMIEGLRHVTGNKVIVAEDDEYYARRYIETMAAALDDAAVVGICMSKYYHIGTRGWARHANTGHASLAQTAFVRSWIPNVVALAKQQSPHYLDMRIWPMAMRSGVGYVFQDDDKAPLYLGMKGLPGRPGIGLGHNPGMYREKIDATGKKLRAWMPDDWRVYEDVVSGSLTADNWREYWPQVTGITVSYNTKDLLRRSYESVRKFHPDMPIIIVDGSDPDDPCSEYAASLSGPLTRVIMPGYNIGHGRGMCAGIDECRTPYALIFDSDIEMLASPVEAMLAMMEPDTFGVGYTEKTGYDGYEYGAHGTHAGEPWMRMLHPYFHLLNIAVYRMFHPYVHHGAPCYLTALDIHKRGLSSHILKEFPGLGHTSGKGHVWTGKPSPWVRHDPAGTRSSRSRRGQGEIEGGWVMNRGQV